MNYSFCKYETYFLVGGLLQQVKIKKTFLCSKNMN